MPPESGVETLEIRLLLEGIHSKYGYDLREYSHPTIRRGVRRALSKSGLRNLGELQHEVLTDRAAFARVLEELTIHVTEMFRDPAFYRAFRAEVMPVLRTYPFLKVWHAGCATGEEVYASAILFTEEGLYDRTQIYATDLSHRALEQAREGTYSTASSRHFEANYAKAGGVADLASYYVSAYDAIAMNDALRRNISFFQHDLVSDHVFGEMHVIFCRNVLIYFGADLRHRVLRKLAQGLCPGGFLCLGSSERLVRGFGDQGFAEVVPGAHIYRYEG